MSFEEEDTTEEHERRIVRCRSCHKMIVFLATASGRSMPVDADTVSASDTVFDAGLHVSHFATCDRPDKFRRAR